ncbi:MAG: HicB like antitoxin of bacterial toxin-antitoxin system [Rubritepida sp.]|nr:HicB like antitoxin of bacterial toxin-antitoxin system [Rubritepida sp.]
MTVTLTYPAELKTDADGVTIAFPDVPGATAWGVDEDDALRNGADILRTALLEMQAEGVALPVPGEAHERPMVSATL